MLLIDKDMSVINPNHLIEEYLDPTADLIFYDLLSSHDIVINSYLVKNTEYARNFLLKWSLHESSTNSETFHSVANHNVAFYEIYLDEFCFYCTYPERKRCKELWTSKKTCNEINLYKTCSRELLGKREKFESGDGCLVLRSNASNGYWARDARITNSSWASTDFILQEFKSDVWEGPFLSENFTKTLCADPKTAYSCWHYNQSYIKTDNEIKWYFGRCF
ncbi:hypothetical protein M3Y97_00949200 [Aphelenchoides bicaudatus]|nr:hypothetical protein M3Y97_00949200 [Aphelenchoides bicaudatus]